MVYRLLAQRLLAACRAISALFFLLSFFARAGPPFLPPKRPRATAAGFFASFGVTGSAVVSSDVAAWTMAAASWFTSRGFFFVLKRFCMLPGYHAGPRHSRPAQKLLFPKLTHYPEALRPTAGAGVKNSRRISFASEFS